MQPSPHFQVPEIVDSFDSFTAMRSQFLQYLANNEQLNIIPESKLYHSIYFPYGYCLKYIELMIGQTSRCSLKASVSHRHTFLFNIFRWLIDIGNFGSESIVTHSLSLLNNLITSMVYLCSGRLWSTHIQFLGLTFSISVPYIFDLACNYQAALDHFHLALDWIQAWRVANSLWDLTETVGSRFLVCPDKSYMFRYNN